ncbi:MAG: DUF3365 domain-containing protein [Deltaproteobacteria bacterium]|nr:DUF3365 domain-containing protein [Deltaproteobacteria bacterium]
MAGEPMIFRTVKIVTRGLAIAATVLTTLGLLGSCRSPKEKSPDLPSEPPPASLGAQAQDAAARARAVLKPVKESFLATLSSMMAQGTEEAIAACRVIAPGLTQAASKEGIAVGRTSHRLRNPANAPRDWVKPFLEEFQKIPTDPQAFRTVALPDGKTGYVEPIYVKPLCLHCHGAALSEPVAAKIQSLYPKDQATGFKEGDFRGLFWVEMEK